ncbi:MAG: chromosomal replication initiator protein DnaA [Ruminococcaceae bacterium]|nr:chromosomal replication initiator protein DnaA [Oscillospiraceae bacterium]
MAIDSVKELWDRVLENCKETQKITDVGINVWMDDFLPEQGEDGTFYLITSNVWKKKTVDSYYREILEKSLQEICGIPMKIEIIVREIPKEQTVVAFDKNEGYTFENFVVGSSNKFAHAAAMAVADNPSSNIYNPLFIYGNSGVGKTHILKAIKNSVETKFGDKKVLYISGEEFVNELVQAIRSQTTDLFHNRFRSVDVLLIDDIHFIAGKDYAQEEFFNTFNALHPEKQIVVTSDRPPREIKTLEERIRSRFESGIIADMSPPDFETRVGILKSKSEQLNLEIDDDVLYFIAEQVKSNIRQLEGIIKKLQAYVTIHSNKLNLPLVQSYIRDVVSETMPDPVTVEKIVDEVSRTYNVSTEDIFSRKKSAEIAKARQISMYIVHEVMGLSSTEIGKKFNKDHTTVLYTTDKVKKLIKTNEMEKRIIEDIIKNVNS